MSVKNYRPCPKCGTKVEIFKNPFPTVDIIIEIGDKIVLIDRKQEPFGWAIPGGFVDYGESVENTAAREAKEETSLDIEIIHLLGVYSDPNRDPRHQTISTVYVAKGSGELKAADDAKDAKIFSETDLPKKIVFDHAKVLRDYYLWKRGVFSE